MVMKLTTETIKLRFPNVPNISTEELCELMTAESSKRKLVLLVSSAPVSHHFWSTWILQDLWGRLYILLRFRSQLTELCGHYWLGLPVEKTHILLSLLLSIFFEHLLEIYCWMKNKRTLLFCWTSNTKGRLFVVYKVKVKSHKILAVS